MASNMSNSSPSPAVRTNRGDRPNSFDRVPTMKAPLRLGNGYTANGNLWDGGGSIWGSSINSATFVDGVADLELRSGSVSHSNGGAHHARGRTSTGALLSPSEADYWNGRSNFSWGTATNGVSSAVSRPQGQALSAVHLRNGEHKPSTVDLQSNGPDLSSLFPLDQQSHFDASKYALQDPSPQSTSVSQSRNTTSNQFLNFNVDHKEEEWRRNANNVSFRANSSAISAPSGLRFLNATIEPSSLRHGKVRPNHAPTKSRNNFDLPEMLSGLSRAPYPSDLSHHSTLHSPHRPSASTQRPLSGMQDRALQYDHLEDQLATGFHNMDLQAETMSQDLASRSQPPGHLPRAPHHHPDRSFEAGLSRPMSHRGSEDMGIAGTFPASSDGMAETGYPFSGYYYRSTSFGERGSSSPAASDYRRGLSTPLYSTSGGTPPTRPESVQSASGSGFSNHASNSQPMLVDRESRASRPPSSEEQYTMSNALPARLQYNQPYEMGGYPGSLRLNPLALPYPLPAYHGLTHSYPSRYPSRENDASQIVRSPLLEDFRANHKTNKRYELKDIYGHVVEFSGDQHGSRFIQQKLETANSDEKDQIFAEIQPNSLQLMTDVFGNYVVQKLFEHGNQAQKKILANQMKNHVMDLSTQMYGCRVVQKALEHILTDQQAAMVKELEAHVLKCVKDQNGNHVIQKAIERVPAEHIQFIINAFTGQVARLAIHPYGCRVIQRMLEHCEEPARQSILRELHAGVQSLITDQYGNYVIQHVIEKGQEQDRTRVVATVISQLLSFSKHKFASNVVEKSIQCANATQRADILRILTSPNERGESPLLGLMRDQYGNYVIQKSLRESGFKDVERKQLVEHCKPDFEKLKKYSSGKQVLALEKLIYDDDLEPNLSSSQSSTIPSTNTSTVEGPTTFTLPPLQILKQSLVTEPVTAIASTPT